MTPGPGRLYDYARRYRLRHGGAWPTVRQCARRFSASQETIALVAEEAKDAGFALDLIVGFRTSAGYAEYDEPGDYEIETYDDSDASPPSSAS